MENGQKSGGSLFPFSILLVLLLVGCVPKNTTTDRRSPYKGPTEPMYAVVEAINKNNSKLPTLWASVKEMEASIVDDKGKRHDELLGGTVLYRAPRDVKIIGTKDPIGSVVEIGSNAEQYWMVAKDPGPDTAWWGRYKYLGSECSRPIPIRPDLVLEVLGISTINEDFNALPSPVMRFNNDSDAYMFVWSAKLPDRWIAVKEVWYDRATKRPKLVVLFDADGRIVLRAYLDKHKPVELADVPEEQWPTVATEYKLYFPENGSRLRMLLDDVKLSRKGAPSDATFRFNPDPRRVGVAKVIQLDEDCGP